jgi:hypothetical protein
VFTVFIFSSSHGLWCITLIEFHGGDLILMGLFLDKKNLAIQLFFQLFHLYLPKCLVKYHVFNHSCISFYNGSCLTFIGPPFGSVQRPHSVRLQLHTFYCVCKFNSNMIGSPAVVFFLICWWFSTCKGRGTLICFMKNNACIFFLPLMQLHNDTFPVLVGPVSYLLLSKPAKCHECSQIFLSSFTSW